MLVVLRNHYIKHVVTVAHDCMDCHCFYVFFCNFGGIAEPLYQTHEETVAHVWIVSTKNCECNLCQRTLFEII